MIKNFTPPQDASPFNPAKTVTVPAGGSTDVLLKGRKSDVFGLNRILPYGEDLSQILVSASLNNRRIIFDDIQLSAVRELFQDSHLKAPFIIQRNNDLTFTLSNRSSSDMAVNMELLGYNGDVLRKLVQDYQMQGLTMPTPVFLFGSDTLAGGAKNKFVNIPTLARDVQLQRMAVKTDDDPSVRVSLQLYNETIKNDVFVPQINDEFSNGRQLTVPVTIKKSVPFGLKATNSSSNSLVISYLGEAYLIYDNQNQ
jgi:hypothetical protein